MAGLSAEIPCGASLCMGTSSTQELRISSVLIAMGWKNNEALNRHAAERLRDVLKREPSSKEIAHLRHGEQVLNLDRLNVAKSGQLTNEATVLRSQSTQLVIEARARRKKSRRLRRAAAKRRTEVKKP